MENKEIKTEDLNKSELNELELESISSGKTPSNVCVSVRRRLIL